MRAVPSHPMGHFPWESHSHGQAWIYDFNALIGFALLCSWVKHFVGFLTVSCRLECDENALSQQYWLLRSWFQHQLIYA